MSRVKLRGVNEVCADCNQQDPSWSSVNRGVTVCDECCSVHRSLGRHISQIKSLKKASWSPTSLAMVHQLVSIGANNIWEHSLLDPTQNKQGRRKPNPRDPVHPTKADFIRAKYQFLAFSNKKFRDGENNSLEDLSKQLYSTVRTANLETSLRLLSSGADPNYIHPEKGNCSLHIAAQEGQSLQVELLVIYGADPGTFDPQGKTPVDYAKAEGHTDLADRLVECQFELTDRLANYLCGRKPDHRNGQHFIIPEMADSSLDLSELAKAAKKKLQALSNHLFEELAMDVYDEVDRRELDAIWLSTQNHSALVSDRTAVPFLPVNPEFSSTRNQGRQKLARFNTREFATLIIDILSDARRRQQGVTSPTSAIPKEKDKLSDNQIQARKEAVMRRADRVVKTSSLSDDEPLYDSVASDEDYSSIGDNQSIKEDKKEKRGEAIALKRSITPTSMISFTESMASSDQSDGPITLEEYLDVKKALAASEARVSQLIQANKDLRQEITLLQNMVQKIMSENATLRSQIGSNATSQAIPNGHEALQQEHETIHLRAIRGVGNRPQSMFEARDPPKQQWQKVVDHNTQQVVGYAVIEHYSSSSHSQSYSTYSEEQSLYDNNEEQQAPFREEITVQLSSTAEEVVLVEDGDTTGGENVIVTSGHLKPQLEHQSSNADSDYDNANPAADSGSSTRSDSTTSGIHTPATPSTSSQDGLQGAAAGFSEESAGGEGEKPLPSQEEVVKKTEKITKKIQELLISAQEGKRESYFPCSEKISSAVNDMASLFPKAPKREDMRKALQLLSSGAARLREECKPVPAASEVAPPAGGSTAAAQADPRLKTQQVIQCAYDIAKAAKQLVTLFE